MFSDSVPIKILFVDDNEASFMVWQCVAAVLEQLPPLEMVYAASADEALTHLDEASPDVVVLNFDENSSDEHKNFLQGLAKNHPPVVVTGREQSEDQKDSKIIYIEVSETLHTIHQTLFMAATAAAQPNTLLPSMFLH